MNNDQRNIPCLHCGGDNTSLHCKARDVEYFTTDKVYNYYRCSDCSVLFIDPVPLNELSVIYPDNYYSFTNRSESFAFRMKNKLDGIYYKRILKDIPGEDLNVLDIGGGTGSLLTLIRSLDKRVSQTVVVDIDPLAETRARSNGHKYFRGRIEDFNEPTEFDLILMLNLIEHVANPSEVLKKAASLLQPGGMIIIKTPNHNSWDARIFRNRNWVGYHCPRHWVIFNKDAFKKLSFDCGLKVERFSYTQGAPFWAQSVLHLLHKKKLIKASTEKPLIYHPLFAPLSLIFAVIDLLRKPFAPLSQMFFVLKKNTNINGSVNP